MSNYGALGKFIKLAALFSGDTCLIWPFAIRKDGYGEARRHFGGLAHRALCFAAHGHPPFEDAEAAHSCGVRACMNPAHVYWATAIQNAADRERHGRQRKGSDAAGAVLTRKEAAEIRDSAARGVDLAEKYRITPQEVCHIRKGRRWAWLEK